MARHMLLCAFVSWYSGVFPNLIVQDPPFDYADLRKQYVLTYQRPVLRDTSMWLDGHLYKISLTHECLLDSGLFVPKEFVWEGGSRRFATHNFVAKIRIRKDESTIYRRIATKNTFRTLLDAREKRFATITTASFNRYDKSRRSFIFNFSISIPVTDLGVGVVLLVDQSGRDSILLAPL